MEKRIHAKKSTGLTLRHYLFHFKWPLTGIFFLSTFLLFSRSNFTSTFFPFLNNDDSINPIIDDVIYPVTLFDRSSKNISIVDYFTNKDRLKSKDDVKSMKRNHKVVVPYSSKVKTKSSYLILEFTPVFNRPRFCSSTKEQIFGSTCPFTNCEYTCEKSTHEKDADVLLMHKRDLNLTQLDGLKRNLNQIWLLWHDESNENSPQINKYLFNWTITYRTSAEASLAAYGVTMVKDEFWSKKQFNSWIDIQFEKRLNQAVWFVSNCGPKKRLNIFQKLRNFYSIAAFGKCIRTNESFSLNAHAQSTDKCGRQSSCEKSYLTSSKFYLAFESQTCTDYITEKFWRTLHFGAIPIVSGPKRENYERVAPPNSFIHVDDYGSEEKLAEALKAIENDRNLFEKFHRWRRFYDVYYEAKDLDPIRFCELCYRLNTNQQRIWYDNINQWFLESC